MATTAFDIHQRPRELRRRVMLPARVRIGARWSDACILNLSSRGLMIRTGDGADEGSVVELRRGDQAIFARVIWRDGSKAGLHTDEYLPVEEIMTLDQVGALQVTAADSLAMERRRKRRPIHHDSRRRARLMQFVGTLAIAVGLSMAVLSMVYQAFARPLAMIEAALGG
jgi:hypothetical protein